MVEIFRIVHVRSGPRILQNWNKEQNLSVIRLLLLEEKWCCEVLSVFDEPRPHAPKTIATEDNVTKVLDFLLVARRAWTH